MSDSGMKLSPAKVAEITDSKEFHEALAGRMYTVHVNPEKATQQDRDACNLLEQILKYEGSSWISAFFKSTGMGKKIERYIREYYPDL